MMELVGIGELAQVWEIKMLRLKFQKVVNKFLIILLFF